MINQLVQRLRLYFSFNYAKVKKNVFQYCRSYYHSIQHSYSILYSAIQPESITIFQNAVRCHSTAKKPLTVIG